MNATSSGGRRRADARVVARFTLSSEVIPHGGPNSFPVPDRLSVRRTRKRPSRSAAFVHKTYRWWTIFVFIFKEIIQSGVTRYFTALRRTTRVLTSIIKSRVKTVWIFRLSGGPILLYLRWPTTAILHASRRNPNIVRPVKLHVFFYRIKCKREYFCRGDIVCHARVSRDKGSGQIAFAYFYGLTERTQQKVYIMLQKCKLYNFKVFFFLFFWWFKKKITFFSAFNNF